MAGLVPSETVQLVLAEADKLTPKKHNLGEKETKDNKTHVIISVTQIICENRVKLKLPFLCNIFRFTAKTETGTCCGKHDHQGQVLSETL